MIAFLLVSLLTTARGQDTLPGGRFILEGRIRGRDTGIVVLQYTGVDDHLINDTAILQEGAFIFKGTLREPSPAFLIGNTHSISLDDPNRKLLFLTPGHLTADMSEGNFQHAIISGSSVQDEFEQLNLQLRPFTESIDSLASLRAAIKEDDTSTTAQRSMLDISHRIRSLLQLKYKTTYTFIAHHPNSILSAFLMNFYRAANIPADSARRLYNSFSSGVKHSRSGIYIKQAIDIQESTTAKHPAPDFTRKAIDGRLIKCSSFKGKYVLLDFWESYCAPCRELSPHLRDLYAKYHPKGLELISISFDPNVRAWKNAIQKDSTGAWIHIGRFLNEKYPAKDIENKYALSAWPMLVLIDKKGYIVGWYTGGEDQGIGDLDNKLRELID